MRHTHTNLLRQGAQRLECPSCRSTLVTALVGLDEEMQICEECGWEEGDESDPYPLDRDMESLKASIYAYPRKEN